MNNIVYDIAVSVVRDVIAAESMAARYGVQPVLSYGVALKLSSYGFKKPDVLAADARVIALNMLDHDNAVQLVEAMLVIVRREIDLIPDGAAVNNAIGRARVLGLGVVNPEDPDDFGGYPAEIRWLVEQGRRRDRLRQQVDLLTRAVAAAVDAHRLAAVPPGGLGGGGQPPPPPPPPPGVGTNTSSASPPTAEQLQVRMRLEDLMNRAKAYSVSATDLAAKSKAAALFASKQATQHNDPSPAEARVNGYLADIERIQNDLLPIMEEAERIGLLSEERDRVLDSSRFIQRSLDDVRKDLTLVHGAIVTFNEDDAAIKSLSARYAANNPPITTVAEYDGLTNAEKSVLDGNDMVTFMPKRKIRVRNFALAEAAKIVAGAQQAQQQGSPPQSP